MNKFKVVSDIHLEFYNINHIKFFIQSITENKNNKDTYLLLAGDIGKLNNDKEIEKYTIFLTELSDKFKHIYLIMGYHEQFVYKMENNYF